MNIRVTKGGRFGNPIQTPTGPLIPTGPTQFAGTYRKSKNNPWRQEILGDSIVYAQITVGLIDQHDHDLEYTVEQVRDFVIAARKTQVGNRGGASITPTKGFYFYEDEPKRDPREDSAVVIIYFEPLANDRHGRGEENVQEFALNVLVLAEDLAEHFNQEAVIFAVYENGRVFKGAGPDGDEMPYLGQFKYYDE